MTATIPKPATLIRVWFTMANLPGEGWSEYVLYGETPTREFAETFGRGVRSRFTRVEILGPVDLNDLG